MVAVLLLICFAAIALYVAAIKWLFRVAVFVVAAVWDLAHGRTPKMPAT